MAITEQDVLHVAKLARLSLSREEVQLYQGQLGRILEHIAALDALDLASVEPTAHVLNLANVLRPDEPRPFEGRADILQNAPERKGDYFKVPKVLA